MAKICLCLTAKTIKRNLEILSKHRKYTDIAELRVDCLDPDERFFIRHFPEQAGVPVILTIRRTVDGGYFTSGEGARINLLARGLAFANADHRRNFAYVDIEENLKVPSLEEAARTFGTRIIRSYHNINGTDEDFSEKIHSMKHSGDEIIKIAVKVNSTADVLRLFKTGKKNPRQEKILIGMGHYGAYSRILAEQFGSCLSYTNALSEPETLKNIMGQTDVNELVELYRFRNITKATKVYGVVGNPLIVTGSPRFFNTIFKLEDIDAVYVPFPADSVEAFMELAEGLNVSGLSVTVPYKEAIIPFLYEQSEGVQSIGACNTLSRDGQGWKGTNTDVQGFSDSLLEFMGKKNFKRMKATIIGAGGVAKAVAAELYRLGGKALILNRSVQKARDLATFYKFAWGGLDSQGIEMMKKYRDIIIQATPVGMEENDSAALAKDPLEAYDFSGREVVMDVIYDPERTAFLKRAANAGCLILNGYDMLIRQAQYQYTQFIGRDFPRQLLARVKFGRKHDGTEN
jgi:3-dehydroquinate dehydratase/shikimate dehydrogenase